MQGGVERLLALDRAIDEVRFAERLLLPSVGPGCWRGPASDAFVRASDELPLLLHRAATALERERTRTALLTGAE